MLYSSRILFEDTTQESPAQDPSLSSCYSLITYNLPRHLHNQRTTSRSLFGWRTFVESCPVCLPCLFHSQRQHRVVTSTHCVAQVLERMKSLRLHHRMSILRLFSRSWLGRVVAELLEKTTGLRGVGIRGGWRVGVTERGTTGAGRPQIAGVPRVHRFRELDGRGTTGDNIRHGQTRVWLES